MTTQTPDASPSHSPKRLDVFKVLADYGQYVRDSDAEGKEPVANPFLDRIFALFAVVEPGSAAADNNREGWERRAIEMEKALNRLARAARRVLDAKEMWRSPDRGSHPNLVIEEAGAWIELQACFDNQAPAPAPSGDVAGLVEGQFKTAWAAFESKLPNAHEYTEGELKECLRAALSALSPARGGKDRDIRSVFDKSGLPDRFKPGHPNAYLNALLDYTGGFYSAATECGMKAGPAADAMQHVERAARGLHALATAPHPHVTELVEAAKALIDHPCPTTVRGLRDTLTAFSTKGAGECSDSGL